MPTASLRAADAPRANHLCSRTKRAINNKPMSAGRRDLSSPPREPSQAASMAQSRLKLADGIRAMDR